MDVTASTERLAKIVQFVAIAQTGRIQIAIDTMNELNAMMDNADIDEQKAIERQLHKLEWSKSSAAKNLALMMDIMKQLNIDSTKFGQVLVTEVSQ